LVRALMVIQSTPSTSKWGLLVAAGEFGYAITHAARLSGVFCLRTNFSSYVLVAWQCCYLVFSTCCYQTFRWCQLCEQICQLNSGMFNYSGFWLLKYHLHVIKKIIMYAGHTECHFSDHAAGHFCDQNASNFCDQICNFSVMIW
jgi:hypothetical protein